MNYLAIDTATAYVSCAVVRRTSAGVQQIAGRQVHGPSAHAEVLAPAVRDVCDEAGVAMPDLDGIVVGLGPGPFTGLRVGIVTAAAIGDALGLPVYGVCSLDAFVGGDERTLVVTDARRREVYFACYEGKVRVEGPDVLSPAALVEHCASQPLARLVQCGADKYAEQLAQIGGEVIEGRPDLTRLVAAAQLDAQPDPLRPLYLRRPDAATPKAPPPLNVTRPAAMPTMRPMQTADIDAVVALEQMLFGPSAWSAQAFDEELAQPGTRDYLVMEQDGVIAGYAGLAVFGPEGHIMTLGVHPDHRRAGTGRAMLRALLDEAARRGAAQVLLEVRQDNPAAIALYESEGFAAVAVRKGYYQPEGVDAVVMVRG